ncbi:MAG: DUF2784 domain-containing protein [Pseudomonadota bacterium]|nr:DUF2784 domain-containing protein [Pseudomonadota bacterium]
MTYRVLADAVLVLHLAFILFVVLGGWLVAVWPKLVWLHLPVVAWGASVEFFGLTCPLTPLENWLRDRGGDTGYSGGFIDHYLTPLMYPAGLTRGMQLALGGFVIAINLAAYAVIWRRRRRAGVTGSESARKR